MDLLLDREDDGRYCVVFHGVVLARSHVRASLEQKARAVAKSRRINLRATAEAMNEWYCSFEFKDSNGEVFQSLASADDLSAQYQDHILEGPFASETDAREAANLIQARLASNP